VQTFPPIPSLFKTSKISFDKKYDAAGKCLRVMTQKSGYNFVQRLTLYSNLRKLLYQDLMQKPPASMVVQVRSEYTHTDMDECNDSVQFGDLAQLVQVYTRHESQRGR
jgi:hypothetical protein